MNSWMIFWTILLITAVVCFVGMLILVSQGAIRELRQALDELRMDARETAEHPEILDEAL